MKARFFLVVAFSAVLLMACNNDNPDRNALIGTWSEPYHVDITVKSIMFNANGTLEYLDVPDTTWETVIDWGGHSAKLNYVVKNNKLYFSGDSHPLPFVGSKPFAFSSEYSIENNMLTIDSFSYDGGIDSRFYKPLILYKR